MSSGRRQTRRRLCRESLALALLVSALAPVLAQPQPPALVGAQFDVVSIKPHKDDGTGGGMRTLPDGTFMMTGIPIANILRSAALEPVFEVKGVPGWAQTERYDLTAKPAPDSHPTREQTSKCGGTCLSNA